MFKVTSVAGKTFCGAQANDYQRGLRFEGYPNPKPPFSLPFHLYNVQSMDNLKTCNYKCKLEIRKVYKLDFDSDPPQGGAPGIGTEAGPTFRPLSHHLLLFFNGTSSKNNFS